MRALAFLISIALVFLSTSCGVHKQSNSNATETSVSSVTENEGLVQTTFFGAKFGDEGQYAVIRTMSYNNGGRHWVPLQKNQWIATDIEFAGRVWLATSIFFTDNKFSHIVFSEKEETKNRGQEIYTELYQLLSQKYHLKKHPSSDLGEDFYIFRDSYNNTVSLTLQYSEDVDGWMVMLLYTWGKAMEIKEEKALNEI